MNEKSVLDAIDRRIIAVLQVDASISNAELGDRVGSTGPSCWRRIRALEEAGILSRPVRIASQARLGHAVNIFCNVRMRGHEGDSIATFEDFATAHPQIMECYSVSGEWDYLMRVVASDVADYEAFLMRTLLKHPSVAGASSHFALSVKKYTTALPIAP